MDIEFIVNDYLLAWYLLFKPSYSSEVQSLKEKLWKNYKKQYSKLQTENVEILKYTKDFIPDDDTIYNLVFETDLFKQVKKDTTKHRQFLMQVYDKNKKEIEKQLNDIVRFKEYKSYHINVVYPELDVIEYIRSNPNKNIAWGKKEDEDDELKSLMHIIYTIIKYEIGDYHNDNREIVTSILDLAINNELYTRISGTSQYEEGYKKLRILRRQLYPYWLMYLGCDKEELVTYMMRDRIAFDIDKYQIERALKKVDLYGFIGFCCKNQKYIIRLNDLEII